MNRNYFKQPDGYRETIERGIAGVQRFRGGLTEGNLSREESIQRLKTELAEVDAVVIGAGAGLSTSAGFIYNGERFQKYFSDFAREALGNEYKNYNLVICGATGFPLESSRIQADFNKLIEKHDLPNVVFHSLRHSSITYKLKLNGGDVKSVQGDSGHSQTSMVTDVYSHILDEDRRTNAQRFEEAFYSGKGHSSSAGQSANAGTPGDAATLMKLLTNPETAGLLKALVNAMGNEDNK